MTIMKTIKKLSVSSRVARAAALVCMLAPSAMHALTFDETGSAAESIYARWRPVAGAVRYEVTYSGAGLADVAADCQLVRRYPEGLRVDIPGLAAGDYALTVRAYGKDGMKIDEGSTENINVYAHTREGFAFTGGNVPGAYNSDGTLRDGARVLYVSAATVNSVTLDVTKDKKGNTAVQTGLANILSAIGKVFEKRPLAIRIIGTVADSEFEGLKDGNYLNLQGNNNTDRMIENITIEGIGSDATLYGYGICFKRAHNIEIRNVAIMLFGDDAVSMDTDNTNIWLHNIDFFYGRPGRDADQVKGDGSIDMKYHSTDITINNNHFFDSGKVMGCGGTTGEEENLRITYHHNWFDHADSRCPRLHYTTAHVYNNYYDGVPVYCIGNTTESSAFIEANYFRNCKRPIMTSGQGTDKYDPKTGTYTLKGTFSGQEGGVNKVYNNIFAENVPTIVYQTGHPTQFDAYIVDKRDEQIPSDVKSVNGGWSYSNFDTAPDMYPSVPDAPEDVPAIVTSRAGRVQGGDFKWTFDNTKDDADHEVNTALKEAVTNYKSSLVAIQGPEGFAGSTSAITDITISNPSGRADIYDLSGRHMGRDFTALPAGLYIVRTSEGVVKMRK